jgi:hypothetical protein
MDFPLDEAIYGTKIDFFPGTAVLSETAYTVSC